jgi:hypothetical protein
MGRVLTADGKRKSVGLKVSEAKFDAIEAARGRVPRAQWLEALVDAALAGGMTPKAIQQRTDGRAPLPPASPPPEVVEDAIVPLERGRDRKRGVAASEPSPVEAVRALAEASGVPLVTASQLPRPARPPRCAHPGTRVIGGYCKECDRLVGPGGY